MHTKQKTVTNRNKATEFRTAFVSIYCFLYSRAAQFLNDCMSTLPATMQKPPNHCGSPPLSTAWAPDAMQYVTLPCCITGTLPPPHHSMPLAPSTALPHGCPMCHGGYLHSPAVPHRPLRLWAHCGQSFGLFEPFS